MRLQSRPGYFAHRAFHRALVRFHVWRNNRSVAEAFRDAEACDAIYRGRLSPQARAGRAFLAVAVLIGLGEGWHYHRTGAFAWPWRAGSGTAEAPLASTPSAAGTPAAKPGSAASASAAPASNASSKTASAKAVPAGAASAKTENVALGSLVPAPSSSPSASSSAAPAPESAAPTRFPSGANVLLACKKDRTLYAYARKPSGWARIAAFPMAIGRNAGDKDVRGDARTPEGRFWITGMLAGPSKGTLYGSLIFPLNYPRPSDRAEGKGGDGIWIHGVPIGTLPSFTHGCISLANDDVLSLASLADAATPIVILPDSLGPDPARQIDTIGLDREYPAIAAAYARKTKADTAAREAVLKAARAFVADEQKRFPDLAMQSLTEADRKAILARLEKWRSDWSGRALEAYASNYDGAFRDRQGRPKAAFLDRKSRIFASKSKIEMEIHDPKIEPECYGRVRVSFRQDYLAEGPEGVQRSSENKTLRLDQSPSGWLIITE